MWIEPKNYKVVGEHLAKLRKEAGVTQEELAARLGRPQPFISTYENGQRRVDLLEFLTILEALRLDPAAVFSAIVAKVRPRATRRRR